MIQPVEQDIGRRVIYIPPGRESTGESGQIVSFNEHYVLVRYRAGQTARATARENLYWPVATTAAPIDGGSP